MSRNFDWALTWSRDQNSFHVEPMADMLKRNQDAFVADVSADYVLLAAGSEESVRTAAEAMRCVLMQRKNRMDREAA